MKSLANMSSELQAGIQIKYRVGETKEFGKAVFAEEDIPKGTLLHVLKEGVNFEFIGREKELRKRLQQYPDKESKKKFLEHLMIYDGLVSIVTDDWTYVNHSDPNVQYNGNFNHDFALKDIKKGDMFVENYHKCYEHPEWLMKLIAEYDVDPNFF